MHLTIFGELKHFKNKNNIKNETELKTKLSNILSIQFHEHLIHKIIINKKQEAQSIRDIFQYHNYNLNQSIQMLNQISKQSYHYLINNYPEYGIKTKQNNDNKNKNDILNQKIKPIYLKKKLKSTFNEFKRITKKELKKG